MMTYEESIDRIRTNGHRLTKARMSILEVLWMLRKPLAVSDIRDFLKRRDVSVNKTTVYRELEFLSREKYIDEVRLYDGRKYYEYVSDHHHHLICIACNRVDDVILTHEFEKEEKRIESDVGFKVLNHSLEFFGLCSLCR